MWRTRIGLQYALLEATVGKLHNMPLRMQRSEGVGAIMTRLDRSIQGFVGAVTQILFNIVPSLVFLLISVWIMLQLDWRLPFSCWCSRPCLVAFLGYVGGLFGPVQGLNIGVVLQGPLLFNDSIRANISYSRPAASMAEVEQEARAANAHELIMRLPEGYNSLVGERGGLLSAVRATSRAKLAV